MSLSFDFPDHLVIQFGSAPQQAQETPGSANQWQLDDLDDLSGEEEDDSDTPCDLPQQHAPRACPAAAAVMPDEVLLLVVDLLGLHEAMGLACCCQAWHQCLLHSHRDIWEQQERKLLGECRFARGGGAQPGLPVHSPAALL
jgi:hypothetical protein